MDLDTRKAKAELLKGREVRRMPTSVMESLKRVRARPKSARQARPSAVSKILAGFKSR